MAYIPGPATDVGYAYLGCAMVYRAPSPERFGLSSRVGQAITRAGIVAWSMVGIALVAYGLWRIAAVLRFFMIAIGLAVLIVIVLEPAVSRLERRRVPRVLATAIVFLAILIPGALALWALGGVLFAQIRGFADQAPALVAELDTVTHALWDRAEELGFPLPADSPEAWVEENREQLIDSAVTLVTAATRLTAFVLASLVGPVVAFYILAELPRIRRSALNLLPIERRERVLEGLRIVGRSVGAFFRGQLLIAFLVGILSTVGLLILGVPYAVLIGTIAGVTNLVPFLGPIVGSVPGILLGWFAGGPVLALWVLVLFVVIQQFESHVLSPLILGATVRLRPVAVVIGMLAGAAAAGLLGMILAVPALASIKSLYERFGPSGEPDVAA